MVNKLSDCAIVILAGGKSSRAETIKGLRNYNNTTWILHQIETLLSYGFSYIFIGLGYHSEKYISVLQNNKHANYFINETPEYGPFSTLHTVLTKTKSIEYKRLFILPVDTALSSQITFEQLCGSYKVIKPKFTGKPGHPISISKEFCNELILKTIEHSRLDLEIRALSFSEILYKNVDDDAIVTNLNTEEAWLKFLNAN